MQDIEKMLDGKIRDVLVRDIQKAGYKHVALDLAGYSDPNAVAMASQKFQR